MKFFERVLGLSEPDDADQPPPRGSRRAPLPATAIQRITAHAQDYMMGAARFERMQLVTPKPDVGIHGAGEPHVVLELRPDAECDLSKFPERTIEVGSNHFGRKHDIRVLCIHEGNAAAAYWCESWQFEPYR